MTHQTNIHIWVISRLYPPNFSGAGIQAHREHRKLVQLGWHVIVLTAGISIAQPLSSKQVNTDGIIVKYSPVIPTPSWSFLSRFLLLYKVFFYISTLLTSITFAFGCACALLHAGRRNDIVNFEGTDTFSIIPIAVARLKGMHPVIRMHLLGSDDPYAILTKAKRGQILEYLNLASFLAVERIVAICTTMLESCLKANIASQKIVSIPHGVDIGLYHPVSEAYKAKLRQKLGLRPQKKYILFVGAAIHRKGIDVMIESFISLQQKMGNVELLIVGPCQFNQRTHYRTVDLQRFVNQCKDKLNASHCDNLVHWVGKVDNVYEYMNAADVFCLPTRREGFGIVIVEAMAAGLPVIVSRLEGVTTDIVRSGQDGILVDGHKPSDYSEVLLRLLSEPEIARQMGCASRQRAEKEYALEKIVNQYAQLYERISDSTVS